MEGWGEVAEQTQSFWFDGLSEQDPALNSQHQEGLSRKQHCHLDDTETQGGQSGLLQARHPNTSHPAKMGSGFPRSVAAEGIVSTAKTEHEMGGKLGFISLSLSQLSPPLPLLCSE